MKQRNYLLALAMLALFAGAGVFYFRSFVIQKPFGIILFVSEGLVTGKLTAARIYDGGADRRLSIEALPNVAILSAHAADFAVPDATAAAGALATGRKLNNRALGLDPAGQSLPNLLETARDHGRAIGLITTGSLTDATPAAFYAHASDAKDRSGLAAQLADHAAPEVILGGGGADFLPDLKGGQRRDARDLQFEMTQRGYTLLRSDADLAAVQPWRGPKLLGLFSDGPFAFRDHLDAQHSQPTLAEMVRRAVEVLQQRAGGYLLVVDAGLVSHASQANEGEHALQELVELDRAIGIALQYAGAKTLVLAAGTESTGGMALNGYPLRQDHGVSLLGMNASGYPSITWATGPSGPGSPSARPDSPAAFYAPFAGNVAEDVIGAGYGPGSERLRGFQDNTFVHDLILEGM